MICVAPLDTLTVFGHVLCSPLLIRVAEEPDLVIMNCYQKYYATAPHSQEITAVLLDMALACLNVLLGQTLILNAVKETGGLTMMSSQKYPAPLVQTPDYQHKALLNCVFLTKTRADA